MKYQSEFNEMSRAIATLYSLMVQHGFTEEQMLAHIETGFHIAKSSEVSGVKSNTLAI